jgi:hypothetical protein
MNVPQSLPLRRSPAAVAELERQQQLAGYISGEERKPEDDPRILREIAQRSLLSEYLSTHSFASVEEQTIATVRLYGDPSFMAAIEERVSEMTRAFEPSDGDIWSKYERPDRRRRLSELVAGVEAAATKHGFAIPRRPAIGTLPTYDLNASALPGPPGEGHIIVFESGMFTFSGSLARITAQAVNADDRSGSVQLLRTPAAIAGHLERHAQILFQFADLLFSQAVLGTSSYALVYKVPSQSVWFADRLIDAVEFFVLAHEYGHIILNHADVHGSADSHDEEFAADEVALRICLTAWEGELWAYAGAALFLCGLDAVETSVATFLQGVPHRDPSSTHPPPLARLAALAKTTQRSSDPHAFERALQMAGAMECALERMTAFLLPAFAKAHRLGYPPAHYRPGSEREKQAALEAFMMGAFEAANPGEERRT